MREIDAQSAADFLRETGRVPFDSEVRVHELSGGVSNVVLRVDVGGQAPFVLKQCREKLRVAMDWRARLDRIWAERAALQLLGEILEPELVPRVLFEDRENYLFAMTCAPDDAVTWKSMLMAGDANPARSRDVGAILAAIHTRSAGHSIVRGTLADVSMFDELRIDPYYRTVARAHPDLKSVLDTLIKAMPTVEPEPTLVLGDYSPKNILVHARGMMLLDFECAHAGDPSFDVGFCLSHLILKLFRARGAESFVRLALSFLEGYRLESERSLGEQASNVRLRRAYQHSAACLMARLDGKSPVEYRGELNLSAVHDCARDILLAGQLAETDREFVFDARSFAVR